MFTEKFPYSNFHDLNLDWILETLKNLESTMQDFIVLNSVTYANPLAWDITRQYPKNQVVLDSNGDGYLSVAPVPVGVEISNTDYWTKIGNFSELWASVKKAITPYDEGVATTATVAHNVDDLVWLNNDLVVITKNIDAGTRYVIGTNCAKTSIDARLSNLSKEIDATNSNLTAQVKTITDKIAAVQTDVDKKVDKDTSGALALTATGETTITVNNRRLVRLGTAGDITLGFNDTPARPTNLAGAVNYTNIQPKVINNNFSYAPFTFAGKDAKMLIAGENANLNFVDGSPVNIETLQTLKKDGTDDITTTLNTYTKQFPLFIPVGTYKISAPVQLKHSLYGAASSRDSRRGTSDTILKYAGNPDAFGSLGVLTVSGNDVTGNITIANLDIECGGMIGGVVFTTDVYTDNAIYNVCVTGVKSYGVYLQPANSVLSRYCYMGNVSVWGYSDDKPSERFDGNVAFYWGDKSPDCVCNDLLAMVCQTGFDCRTNVIGTNWVTYNGIPSGGTGGATANSWWENTCGLKVTNNDVHITNLYLDTVRRGIIFDGPGKAAAYVNNLIYTCNDDTANSGATFATLALIGTSPTPQLTVDGGIINKTAKVDTVVQTTGTYQVWNMVCKLDNVFVYTDREQVFPSAGQKICKAGEHRFIDAAITNQRHYIVNGQSETGDPVQYKAFAYLPLGSGANISQGSIRVSDRNDQDFTIYISNTGDSSNSLFQISAVNNRATCNRVYTATTGAVTPKWTVENSSVLYYATNIGNMLVLYLKRPASYEYSVDVEGFNNRNSPVMLDRIRNLDGTPMDYPRWSNADGMTPIKVLKIASL